MASISNEIKVTMERRPCFVGEKRAWFHQWINKEMPIVKAGAFLSKHHLEAIPDLVKQGIIPAFCDEVILQKYTFALVEYENGTVAEVEPASICFDVELERKL